MSNASGRLYVVATPIGNLGDITLRAVEVLRSVDRVAAEDTRHTRRLLDHLGIHRPMLALHEHNEAEAARRVIGLLAGGESVALVSDAGTPLISDPGFPLIRACREHAIDVTPVPGASALLAALSVAGLPTDRFCFEGFPPRRRAARLEAFQALREATGTLVFYEASHRIVESLEDLVAVFGAARPAVLARELTKLHETIIAAPLGEMLERLLADTDQRRGEFVLVVGGAPGDAAAVAAAEVDTLLRVLVDELPLRQAAAIAARLTGGRKNLLYQRALELAPPD